MEYLVKIITCDVDGVVLNYNDAFTSWMENKGFPVQDEHNYDYSAKFNLTFEDVCKHCDEFSNSEELGMLTPISGAVYHINKLHSLHGYRFHFITSIATDPTIVAARTRNIERHILKGAIKDITCLGFLANKKAFLEEHYSNTGHWWIEDSVTNYVDGIDVGLRGLLVDQPYNRDYNTTNRVHSWDEIYDRITTS